MGDRGLRHAPDGELQILRERTVRFWYEQLKELVGAWQSDPTSIAALVFGCTLLLGLWVIAALRSREPVQRRLARSSEFRFSTAGGRRRSVHFSDEQEFGRFIEAAGRLVAPSSKSELSSIQHQLVQAGYLSNSAVAVYYAIRVMFACALPLAFLLFYNFLPVEVPGFLVMGLTAAIAICGLLLPAVLLDWRRSAVRDRYRRTFPDMMDLLVVCIESGQSLHAALERVAKEIMPACPELGANMHLVCLELRAGRSLTDCLDGLYERVGIDEVKSLKLLLKQSEELGSSIATTLRVYADEMRDKRLIRAETKAHALPVKLTIPLGMFIFPVILLVIMVPLFIRISNSLL